MARDATAREHGTDFSLLDRRSSLALAGATPTPPRATGTATATGAVSSDTATPAGETRTFETGDRDTFRYSGDPTDSRLGTTADVEVRDGPQ